MQGPDTASITNDYAYQPQPQTSAQFQAVLLQPATPAEAAPIVAEPVKGLLRTWKATDSHVAAPQPAFTFGASLANFFGL